MPSNQLDEAWKSAYVAAEKQFHKLAKKNWRDQNEYSLRGPMTGQNIRDMLDTEKLKLTTDKDRARHSKWTNAVKKVLTPVDMLSGLIAGTIAIAMPGVGAPAGLACNALTYLIQTGRAVSGAYDKIGLLFEQMGQFANRFDRYSEHDIPDDLLSIIHQVLISYIIICGLAIRLTRKYLIEKYVEAFLFGEDKDIKEQMDKLDTLTRFETSMVGALTYTDVKSISIWVEALFNDWPELRGEVKEIKDQAELIGDKVGDVWQLDKKREANTKYQEQLKKMQDTLNPKTGSVVREISWEMEQTTIYEAGMWLRRHEFVDAWLNKDEPILHIHGNASTGKSYLVHGIVQELLQLYPQGEDRLTNVSVAFHFWRSNQPLLRSLKEALVGLAYAIAQNDRLFAKYFYENCNAVELKQAHELWKKLFLGFFRETDYDNRAYLIFDGLDQVEPRDREAFLELLKELKGPDKNKKSRIRVLLAERSPTGRSLDDLLGFTAPAIHVSNKVNEGDVRLYVRKRVDEGKLWNWMPDLRNEIIDRITENAQGIFRLVDYAIDSLKDKRRPEDITEALQRSPKSLPDAIYNDLVELSATLSPTEVVELQEILSWVICCKERLTLAQLGCLLDKERRGQVDLMYLERQLRTRYNSLLTVVRNDRKTTEDLEELQTNLVSSSQQPSGTGDADGAEQGALRSPLRATIPESSNFIGPLNSVMFRSDPHTTVVELENDDMVNFFREEKARAVSKPIGEVQETEVDIVRNVLKLVCGENLFNRFGFEEFFKQKLRRQTLAIDLDMKAARAKILKDILSIVADETYLTPYLPKDSQSLLEYAKKWFPDHVLEVEREGHEAQIKESIGKLLVSCFHDQSSIERWARDCTYFDCDWIRTDDERLICVRDWLNDPTISEKLSDDEKEWINGKISKDFHYILQPTMSVLAQKWLQGYEWDERIAYEGLERFTQFYPGIPYLGAEMAQVGHFAQDPLYFFSWPRYGKLTSPARMLRRRKAPVVPALQEM